ncbi:MAG: hypothetical protein Q9181_006697 [Wetmoreana brouardii]
MDSYDPIPMSQALRVEQWSAKDRDQDELARLGKKQALKRNFGFMSILGFSCTMLITWEALLILFVQGLTNGGPAGLIYGYLLVWIGTLSVFISMAELVSMAPTSSGQYHWVAMLAPPTCQKFLSYLTGWLTVAGWQAFVASTCYLCATLIQGLIILEQPEYHPKMWHGTLLFWAVAACAVFINTVISRALPALEGLILILHVLGFFAILIPLVYLSPHASSHDVFGRFLNEGGWPSQGLSFFVGLIGNMSEEVRNPSKIVPASMICSMLLNGLLGFGMLVAVLLCIGNLHDVLETSTGYPFMEIFLQGTKSSGGAAAMIAIVIVLAVEPRTCLPLVSIATTTTIAILLSLISIGSTVALNDVLSLTVAGLFLSYLACCVLLLYRRCTGGISEHAITTFSTTNNNPTMNNQMNNETQKHHHQQQQLTWGPFHIPGLLGITINLLGCIFLIIIILFSFWPPVTPVMPSTMNYSVLVTASVVAFASTYYVLWAWRVYTGPVVEVVFVVPLQRLRRA